VCVSLCDSQCLCSCVSWCVSLSQCVCVCLIVCLPQCLTDFDSDSSTFIKNINSRLIVNIPKNWVLNSYSSDDLTLTVSSNPDGSSQIVGDVTNIIDGEGIVAGTTKAGVIEFNVTPPTVTDTKMYVMHILADGYTDANFLIGPIAETVLQVCPTSGCP